MKRADMVERARRCIGHGCTYKLGMGGVKPNAVWPWKVNPEKNVGECDCSGFVAWCLGTSRLRRDVEAFWKMNGGWIETSAIARDAETTHALFGEVSPDQALPGDVVVYGDKGGHQGHVGLVVSVAPTPDPWDGIRVVHCSSGNFKRSGDAIQETGAGLWKKADGLVARYLPAMVSEPVT